jgi:hypothetical protein
MADISITINGYLWDHTTKSGRPVTLVGSAALIGVGVGGGPITGAPGEPLVPTHPIAEPPAPAQPIAEPPAPTPH